MCSPMPLVNCAGAGGAEAPAPITGEVLYEMNYTRQVRASCHLP